MTHRSSSVRWKTVEEFIQSKDSGRIPPSLRMILTSDGLLTTALQSLFLEPVEVEILQQEDSILENEAAGFLRLEPGIPCHVREVWLKSKGRRIVFARSIIPLDDFPPSLLRALAEKSVPLGLLLQESGRPAMKDHMEVCGILNRIHPGFPKNPTFPEDAPLWARRYRLNYGDKNGIFIEEIFGEGPFQGNPDRGGKK